jgi:hypothetical protein
VNITDLLRSNGATATGRNIGLGTSDIMAACGTRGGSGPAFENGNFIIHVHDQWVKRDAAAALATPETSQGCSDKACTSGCDGKLGTCLIAAGSDHAKSTACFQWVVLCYKDSCGCNDSFNLDRQVCLSNCRTSLSQCTSHGGGAQCQSAYANCINGCTAARADLVSAPSKRNNNLDKRYNLVCNGNDLNVYDIGVCLELIAELGFFNRLVKPHESVHLCGYGSAKVTLRALHDVVAYGLGVNIASSMNAIIKACGGRGGSNAVSDQGELIVHINPQWS